MLVLLPLLMLSVVSLVLGPIVLMLYLGSTTGMLVGLGLILFGAIGLWIGMRHLEARKPGDKTDEGPTV
jgi:hypothetical protein